MKKLLLVVSRKCPRNCVYCCMKKPLSREPRPMELLEILRHPAEEVHLTGGEPMMVEPQLLQRLCEKVKRSGKKIYIWSAECNSVARWMQIWDLLDGITFTLHTREDTEAFAAFAGFIRRNCEVKDKTLRLSVFPAVGTSKEDLERAFPQWKCETLMPLGDCLVPADKDFGEYLLHARQNGTV